jgi:hypothetical protein
VAASLIALACWIAAREAWRRAARRRPDVA